MLRLETKGGIPFSWIERDSTALNPISGRKILGSQKLEKKGRLLGGHESSRQMAVLAQKKRKLIILVQKFQEGRIS